MIITGPLPPYARAIAASGIGTLIAARGLKKGNLDTSGAVAAAVVGGTTLAASLPLGAALLLFYFSGSAFTRVGKERKKKVDAEVKDGGGQRSWKQVFATAGVGTALAVAYALETRGQDLGAVVDTLGAPQRTAIVLAYLGNFACVCGDTWASELGILSAAPPRMITSFLLRQRVPRGTNGGVSAWGTLMSVAGGAFMGTVLVGIDYLTGAARDVPSQLPVIGLGAAAGFVGSLVDSVLGATVQRSWYQPATGRATATLPEGAVVSSEPYQESMLDKFEAGNAKEEASEADLKAPFVVVSGFPLLTNEQVNLASSIITAGLTAYFGPRLLEVYNYPG